MEDARAWMAQILRDMADKLESETNPASAINMTANGFSVTLAAGTVSVQAPNGTALQPPFSL